MGLTPRSRDLGDQNFAHHRGQHPPGNSCGLQSPSTDPLVRVQATSIVLVPEVRTSPVLPPPAGSHHALSPLAGLSTLWVTPRAAEAIGSHIVITARLYFGVAATSCSCESPGPNTFSDLPALPTLHELDLCRQLSLNYLAYFQFPESTDCWNCHITEGPCTCGTHKLHLCPRPPCQWAHPEVGSFPYGTD